jgi:hypothetical protein
MLKKVRNFTCKLRERSSLARHIHVAFFFSTSLIKLPTPVYEINYDKWGNNVYRFLHIAYYAIHALKSPLIVQIAGYKRRISKSRRLHPPW